MSKRSDDNLWPMVMVPKKEWDALVRWFRTTEEITRGSFAVPGNEACWMEEYQQDDPKEFKIFDAARRAASRKFKR
jgi:hypothetical protein